MRYFKVKESLIITLHPFNEYIFYAGNQRCEDKQETNLVLKKLNS
jgi:hypothetical protein